MNLKLLNPSTLNKKRLYIIRFGQQPNEKLMFVNCDYEINLVNRTIICTHSGNVEMTSLFKSARITTVITADKFTRDNISPDLSIQHGILLHVELKAIYSLTSLISQAYYKVLSRRGSFP